MGVCTFPVSQLLPISVRNYWFQEKKINVLHIYYAVSSPEFLTWCVTVSEIPSLTMFFLYSLYFGISDQSFRRCDTVSDIFLNEFSASKRVKDKHACDVGIFCSSSKDFSFFRNNLHEFWRGLHVMKRRKYT